MSSAPAGVLTSSLIKERRSSDTYFPQSTVLIGGGGYGTIENTLPSSTTSGTVSKQQYTKTCGVCHGSGTCNICGGDGWVSRMGMGKDGYCKSCLNHNGKCSACGGRGSWKQ